jgi:hypothetical protein
MMRRNTSVTWLAAASILAPTCGPGAERRGTEFHDRYVVGTIMDPRARWFRGPKCS